MSILINCLIVFVSAIGMEAFAWWAHKYIMHGFGWGWHRSHHVDHENVLEKNDLFAVVFSVFAVGLFLLGAIWSPFWYVGLGITLYGVLYSLVHDGLVHGRYPFRFVPRKGYLKRLVQAHKLHHAVDGKDGCVSFGFLYAKEPRHLKELLQSQRID